MTLAKTAALLTSLLPVLAHGAALEWYQLPPLPDAEGFAGAFAGVSGGALLVAGGANISAHRWEPSFLKRWYDVVFILPRPTSPWIAASPLPTPAAYGVSVTWRDAVLCLGGQNQGGHARECYRLEWKEGALETRPLPPLPRPCANACGALLGDTVYVAGGLAAPADAAALHTFWALDLAAAAPAWRELEPWPGPERMLGVAGVWKGEFFLMSGASLHAGVDGKANRTFLRDAYAYRPGRGWRRIADLPRPAAAAPSPALAQPGGLLVCSGDDGTKVDFAPMQQHPGFPRDVLSYDAAADRWTAGSELPFSRATVPTVLWLGRYVVPNGEARPRVRTNEVWAARVP